MKGRSTRLRNATGRELWQCFQRPLQDLQLWRALAQRLLGVTASLPDLPSIHTFLPQIQVTGSSQPAQAPGVGGCWLRWDVSATLLGTGVSLALQAPASAH